MMKKRGFAVMLSAFAVVLLGGVALAQIADVLPGDDTPAESELVAAGIASTLESVSEGGNASVTAADLPRALEAIRSNLESRFAHLKDFKPSYRDFRAGDVRHSLADISKARDLLGYAPTHRIQ